MLTCQFKSDNPFFKQMNAVEVSFTRPLLAEEALNQEKPLAIDQIISRTLGFVIPERPSLWGSFRAKITVVERQENCTVLKMQILSAKIFVHSHQSLLLRDTNAAPSSLPLPPPLPSLSVDLRKIFQRDSEFFLWGRNLAAQSQVIQRDFSKFSLANGSGPSNLKLIASGGSGPSTSALIDLASGGGGSSTHNLIARGFGGSGPSTFDLIDAAFGGGGPSDIQRLINSSSGGPNLFDRISLSGGTPPPPLFPPIKLDPTLGGSGWGDILSLISIDYLSIASKMMSAVAAWRNLDGKEDKWSGAGIPFWQERRAVPFTFYLKAIASEFCLPVITTVAIVESVAYKAISLISGLFGKKEWEYEYEKFYQSSSFTILWSIGGYGNNLIYNNIATHEVFARLCTDKYLGTKFFREEDRWTLYNLLPGNAPSQPTPPDQTDVLSEARRINEETGNSLSSGVQLLKALFENAGQETLTACKDWHQEAIPFALFKLMHHFAVSHKEEPIPVYFKSSTRAVIERLRKDEEFQKAVGNIDCSTYFDMTPEAFDQLADLPKELIALKGINFEELQNPMFFNGCYGEWVKTIVIPSSSE